MNPTAFSLMGESERESVSNLECVVGVCVCFCVWFQMNSVGVLRGNICGLVCTEALMTISHTV